MKKILICVLLTIISLTLGCDRGSGSINGTSFNSALRSVNRIKPYLPAEQQLEFESGFWFLKDWSENDEKFLEWVHRKDAAEIIALAKEQFEFQKSERNPDLAEYATWDAMIQQIRDQRKLQEENKRSKNATRKQQSS